MKYRILITGSQPDTKNVYDIQKKVLDHVWKFWMGKNT